MIRIEKNEYKKNHPNIRDVACVVKTNGAVFLKNPGNSQSTYTILSTEDGYWIDSNLSQERLEALIDQGEAWKIIMRGEPFTMVIE